MFTIDFSIDSVIIKVSGARCNELWRPAAFVGQGTVLVKTDLTVVPIWLTLAVLLIEQYISENLI